MKRLLAALVLCATLIGCSALGSLFGGSMVPPPPDASNAQVIAGDVVQGLDKAWNLAVPLCLDAERAGKIVHGKCASILLPAEDSIKLAAQLVDTWDSTAQIQVPCLVSQVLGELMTTTQLLRDGGVQIPATITAAETAAVDFASTAVSCPGDAGTD